MNPEICPTCGADVPDGARACPECGADEETGWSDKARYDSLGIPDDSFDYEEFLKREFDNESPVDRRQKFWRGVGIALLVITTLILVIFFVSGFGKR